MIYRFKELREKAGLSQDKLADELSKYYLMKQKDVSNMESIGQPGGKKTIEPEKLNAYIQYFGVSADYILGFTDNMQEHINPDDMACADCLGLSHRAIKCIKDNTKPSESDCVAIVDAWKNAFDSKKDVPLKVGFDIISRCGFALDVMFSFSERNDKNVSDMATVDYFASQLYDMIFEYYRTDTKRGTYKPRPHEMTYRTHYMDMQDFFGFFINGLDFEQLKDFARDYDTRNGSSIYADLFGSDSE